MLPSAGGGLAALRGAHHEALLHEEGLVHILHRVGVLRQRRRQRGQTHRTAAELHAKHFQKAVVHSVEP